MKVKDLIKAFDGNMEVYVSTDSEGNSYGTIAEDTVESYGNMFCVIYPYEEGLDYDELYERHSK